MEINLFNYQNAYGINSNFDAPQEENPQNYLATSSGIRLPFKRFAGAGNYLSLVREESQIQPQQEFSLIERHFTENRYFDFTSPGNYLKSPSDVAWMFHNLENEAVEHTFVVYHFEDDSYFVQHLSTGGIDAALVDLRLIAGNALKSKPTSITLVHNHPSGTLISSRQDKEIWKRLSEYFEPQGIAINPGIIINTRSGQFLIFNNDEDHIHTQVPARESNKPIRVYSFNRHVFVDNYQPIKITTWEETAAYISSQKFGLSDKTELLVLNKANQVMGKFILPQFNQERRIVELVGDFGGTSAIIYGNNVSQDMVNHLKVQLAKINILLVDALRLQGANLKSLVHDELVTQEDLDKFRQKQQSVADDSSSYNLFPPNQSENAMDADEVLGMLQSAFPYVPVHVLDSEEFKAQREKFVGLSQSINKESQLSQTSALNSGRIEDFGEKIGGARKDLYQRQLSELYQVVHFDFRNNVNLKDNIFQKGFAQLLPAPDFKLLRDAGYTLETLKSLYYDYITIPRKPAMGIRSSSKTRAILWYESVQQVASALSKMYQGAEDPAYVSSINELLGTQYNSKLDTPEETDRTLKLIDGILTQSNFPDNDQYNILSLKGFSLGRNFRGHFVATTNNGKYAGELNKLAAQILEDLAFRNTVSNKKTEKKEKEINIQLYVLRGNYFLGYKQQNGNILHLTEYFQDREVAKQYRNDNLEELRQKVRDAEVAVDNLRSPENRVREGARYRNMFPDGNVPIEVFAETFGFRGIEFGNYVNNMERQNSINNAYDGFMDMAFVLNIPPKAISLNGELGIGFGSRGKGGKNAALAHYEPSRIVINLTKNKGAGSLAHEWWHGFDHLMGRTYINNPGAFLSEKNKFGSIRKEIFAGYEHILDSILVDTKLWQRSIAADGGKRKPYYATKTEMTARAFEGYIKQKLFENDIVNDFLVNYYPSTAFGYNNNRYPYPLPEEIDDITEAYDRLFANVQYKEDLGKTILYHGEGGNVHGFNYGGEIFFNRDTFNRETLVHEFSHIYLDAMEQRNPELFERGITLIQENGQSYIDRVESNPLYKDLDKSQIFKEALSLAVGERGKEITENNQGKSRFKVFLEDAKSFIGRVFFWQKKEDIAQLTLDEFLNSTVHDLLQGQDLRLAGDDITVEQEQFQEHQDLDNEQQRLEKNDHYLWMLAEFNNLMESNCTIHGTEIQQEFLSMDPKKKADFLQFASDFADANELDRDDYLEYLEKSIFSSAVSKKDEQIEILMGMYDSEGSADINFQPYSFENIEQAITYLDMQRHLYDINPSLAVRIDNDHRVHLLAVGAVSAFKDVIDELSAKYKTLKAQSEFENPDFEKDLITSEIEQFNQNTTNIMQITEQQKDDLIPLERQGDAFHIKVSKQEAEYLIYNELISDIMCKEYGEDDNWVGMNIHDLDEETHQFDDDYQTFEIDLLGMELDQLKLLIDTLDRFEPVEIFTLQQVTPPEQTLERAIDFTGPFDLAKHSEYLPDEYHTIRETYQYLGADGYWDPVDLMLYRDELKQIGFTFTINDGKPEVFLPLDIKDQKKLHSLIEEKIVWEARQHQPPQELTIEDMVKVQSEQLANWKTVLKSGVYKQLMELVTKNNGQATTGNQIVRGQDIDTILYNDIIRERSSERLSDELIEKGVSLNIAVQSHLSDVLEELQTGLPELQANAYDRVRFLKTIISKADGDLDKIVSTDYLDSIWLDMPKTKPVESLPQETLQSTSGKQGEDISAYLAPMAYAKVLKHYEIAVVSDDSTLMEKADNFLEAKMQEALPAVFFTLKNSFVSTVKKEIETLTVDFTWKYKNILTDVVLKEEEVKDMKIVDFSTKVDNLHFYTDENVVLQIESGGKTYSIDHIGKQLPEVKAEIFFSLPSIMAKYYTPDDRMKAMLADFRTEVKFFSTDKIDRMIAEFGREILDNSDGAEIVQYETKERFKILLEIRDDLAKTQTLTNVQSNSQQNEKNTSERLPYREWLIQEVNEIFPNAKGANKYQIDKMCITLDSYQLEEALKDLDVTADIVKKSFDVTDWLANDRQVKELKKEIQVAINSKPETFELFKEKFSKLDSIVTNGIKR